MSLTHAIKEEAYRLGFSLVGVTTSDPLPHADIFESWLLQGRQGEMSYLDSPRSRLCRSYPDRVLPGCCSVLVLGLRHPTPRDVNSDAQKNKPLRGRIASYAWGEDYHDVLSGRLKALADFVEARAGHPIPNHWYTDTGPLLEREMAQRAGLGWIGKNTCLINPDKGSYFLLGEILLGVVLEPDQPFTADRCGSCTRCIQACPTGCILPDRTLDARRCISYLTIELKGLIPAELRPLMGGWVFGCDVCQSVCPWNRLETSEVDLVFKPSLVSPYPDLLEEMGILPVDFNQKYRYSPIKRAKRRGYLRNVAVALGNAHREVAVPVLARVLGSDPEPIIRAHAAWALGHIEGAASRHTLEKAVSEDTNAMVRAEIQSALDK